VSPPCCGKTTLLRDIVRNISDGYKDYRGQNVSVVDERGEIAGSYKGIASLDVGIRSDVLDGCSKKEGVYMLLRSMSPKVIALDEIGGEEDAYVIRQCVNCGCGIIATIHGWDIEDISNRSRVIQELIEEKIFSKVIVLSKDKIGSISKII
jgi:stage III sporulation protein AA